MVEDDAEAEMVGFFLAGDFPAVFEDASGGWGRVWGETGTHASALDFPAVGGGVFD